MGDRQIPTLGAALKVMRRIWRRPKPGRRLEARAYESCPSCNGWLLTKRGR